MDLKILRLNPEELTATYVNRLAGKELDILHIKSYLNKECLDDFVAESSITGSSDFKISLPDGFFFPLPYAAVHAGNAAPDVDLAGKYFESANFLINNTQALVGQKMMRALADLYHHLQLNNESLLKNVEGRKFAPFNIRMLKAGGNGIFIHCENSFLNELHPGFRAYLQKTVDLENALSVLLVLQSDVSGGELSVYGAEWDDFPIQLADCDKMDRHPGNTRFFIEKGYTDPPRADLKLKEGDMVIFRAAQLWHCINSIGPSKDRISIGFFIAPALNGELKYWA